MSTKHPFERKPVQIWARLDPRAVAEFDAHAEHRGITRAKLMREILEDWLRQHPDKPAERPLEGIRAYDQSDYMRLRMNRDRTQAAATAANRAAKAIQALRDQAEIAAEAVEATSGAIALESKI